MPSTNAVTPSFELSLVGVQRFEVGEHLLTLFDMAAGVFIRLYLIEIAILFPPVEVEVFADICQCFLKGIGTDTEVGVRKFQSGGVDIVLKPYVPALRHTLHHVVKTAGVMPGIVILSV